MPRTLSVRAIAHQIHDTAAQSMVSAYRFLDAARARSTGLSEPADALLREASDRVRTAIQEVRAVLDDLLPPGLEELGLAEALRIRLRDLTADAGAVGVATGDLPRLEGWVEQALYGMAGEAISNAIRHGGAKHISISLREWRRRAIIVIVDDGRGFEPATVARRRGEEGLGLLGMTRQARWLGGRMDLTSRPGSGTQVRISIPLERHRIGITKPAGDDAAPASAEARSTNAGRSGGRPPEQDGERSTRTPGRGGRGADWRDRMTQPSRVLLVDDHEMARRGLTAMLSTADWITVVGEADDCASGLAAIERLRPDIVLLDIRMPVRTGWPASRS